MCLHVKDWHKSSTFLKQEYRFQILPNCSNELSDCLPLPFIHVGYAFTIIAMIN